MVTYLEYYLAENPDSINSVIQGLAKGSITFAEVSEKDKADDEHVLKMEKVIKGLDPKYRRVITTYPDVQMAKLARLGGLVGEGALATSLPYLYQLRINPSIYLNKLSLTGKTTIAARRAI